MNNPICETCNKTFPYCETPGLGVPAICPDCVKTLKATIAALKSRDYSQKDLLMSLATKFDENSQQCLNKAKAVEYRMSNLEVTHHTLHKERAQVYRYCADALRETTEALRRGDQITPEMIRDMEEHAPRRFETQRDRQAWCAEYLNHALKRDLTNARNLWARLGDIPSDNDGRIEEAFLHFRTGTDRQEIWHWFEEKFNLSVHDDLMFPETNK